MKVKALAQRLMGSVRAAARTSLYSALGTLLNRRNVSPTRAERALVRQLWGEAYELQRRMFAQPELARAILTLERQDWRDFLSFAGAMPGDLRRVRHKRRGSRTTVVAPDSFPYPSYYLHDFHHQRNGSLSPSAASAYEWQIRLLFGGTNRLMRQAVVAAMPRGDDLQVLDVGCGTAAWVPQARLLGRHHRVVGVDLSPHYLTYASQRRDPRLQLLQANAEALPADLHGRFDAAVCIWLYHELPAEARQNVTQNIVRALRPGGTLYYLEAAQQRDAEAHDLHTVNAGFAQDFDEPYFLDYQRCDLDAHFAAHGLTLQRQERVFLSTLRVLKKAAAQPAAA